MTDMQRAESEILTWDPVQGGKRAWVCFEDDQTYELGADPDGHRFTQIADRMMSGQYYPADVIEFTGQFLKERRDLKPGDRVLQTAPILGIKLHSAVEIYVAERSENRCKIGYVTTKFHHGRGIWYAELIRQGTHLNLRVKSTASPQSWMFWIGLPIARATQLRARRRAVQEFRKI